jgi:ketose-bisphosphate aldolase
MDLKSYLRKAQKEKWALAQFNFSSFEQLKGILAGAKKMKSPVILGTSEGEVNFLGLRETIALVEISKTKYRTPAFLNLDHGKDLKLIKRAIDFGYAAVHFDGSKLPLEKNIKYAKEIVKYAHKKGVLVEGEVGAIGTESSKIYNQEFRLEEKDLTNPEDAYKFIKETKVDSLAISIGNFHGMKVKGINPHLKLKLLEEIEKKTENRFLVLHGGSGTSVQDIKKAIKLGIVKININTELRKAYTFSLRRELTKEKEITPYKYMPKAIQAVQLKVEEKLKIFN